MTPAPERLILNTLQSLPLFPLGTVLFPGGTLPLRIFEVRYLDMIGKCRKIGAPFGVVSLSSGGEVQKPSQEAAGTFAPETFHNVGTLATITAFSSPQPGLMVIRCAGASRFRIERQERLGHGLWVADVTRIDDDQSTPIPADLQRVADALNKVITTLNARGMADAQLPFQRPYQLDDCAWVANRWCELLPMPPAQKQQMMALQNPLVRLELVSDVLLKAGIVAD